MSVATVEANGTHVEQTQAELDENRRNWIAEVKSAKRRLDEAAAELADAEDTRKQAKKSWEAAQTTLNMIVARDPGQGTLFNQQAEEVTEGPKPTLDTPLANWLRSTVDIVDDETSQRVLAAFAGEGLETIGDAVEYAIAHPEDVPFKLFLLDESSEVRAAIRDAFIEFYAKHTDNGVKAIPLAFIVDKIKDVSTITKLVKYMSTDDETRVVTIHDFQTSDEIQGHWKAVDITDVEEVITEIDDQFATPKSNDAWRSEPLSKLDGLTQKQVDLLDDANIRTIGDLADYCQDDRHQLTDFKGIGKAAADKISDALAEFWMQHPEYCK